MVFRVQKVSDYGTATPVVARTLLQGTEIIKFMGIPSGRKELLREVLWGLQQQLLRCHSIRIEIQNEIEKILGAVSEKGLIVQAQGRVVDLPCIPDLETKAESFLQAAKASIRETARIFEAVYGDPQDHKFNNLAKWAEGKFGAGSEITSAISSIEPWVKSIVGMRNAVDHPMPVPKGRLIVTNFSLLEDHPTSPLGTPSWNLLGEPPQELLPMMNQIIETILEISERFMVLIFEEHQGALPFKLAEIPAQDRDSSAPVRYKIIPTFPGPPV